MPVVADPGGRATGKRPGTSVAGAWAVRVFSYGVFFFLVAPLFVLVAASFAPESYVEFPPRHLSLAWYKAFMADKTFVQAMLLSGELAMASALIATFVGFLAAFILVRKQFPGRKLAWSLFLSPLILPQIVLGVALLQFFTGLGLANTFLGLLFAHVVSVLPYVIRTVAAALVSIDVRVEEAAADLGANKLETLGLVLAPMVKGALIAAGLFAFIMSWVNVEISIFLSATGVYPLPVVLYNFMEYSITTLVVAAAAIAIYVAIALVIFVDVTIGLHRAAI